MKITAVEEKFVRWVRKRWPEIVTVLAVLFSIIVRFQMRSFQSSDMKMHLIPWFLEIQEEGIGALRHLVGNYMVSYQFLIWLMTLIPLHPAHLYKMLSIVFDYLLAFSIYRLVRETTGRRGLSLAALAVSCNFPIFVLNSAMWGQCDSIYAFFCVLTCLELFRGHTTRSFLALGCAFAFKLQSVFLLPFLIYDYLRNRRFSLLNFLWIPAMMILWSLPGLLQGLPLISVFEVFTGQVAEYTYMSANYPSFWNLVVENCTSVGYEELSWFAVAICGLVLMGEIGILLRCRGKMETREYLLIAWAMAYTCVIFLPAMHERYDFLALTLVLILAFLDFRAVPMLLIQLFVDMRTYGQYLLQTEVSWPPLVAFNLAGWLLCIGWFLWSFGPDHLQERIGAKRKKSLTSTEPGKG